MNLNMRLFKRASNGYWYVEYPGGKRRSLGKEVTTEQQARRIFNQLKREFLAGKLADITGHCTVTLGDYVDEFEKWAENVQSRSTFRANMLALKKLKHHAGTTIKLDRINAKHVDMMVAQSRKEGLSTASINNYIRHMRAALNKAREWGYVKLNPLREIREMKEEKRPPAFLGKGEVPRFLRAIHDVDLRRIATAYLATGRRRSELLNLRWEDIDLEHGRYAVKVKGGEFKWFPINSMFRSVLDAIGEGEGRVFYRWNHPDTLSHYVKAALRDAGLGHLHLHHLRHTFASLMVMQGRTLLEVQELLGHTESKTTQIYAHVSPDHLRERAEINLGPIDLGSTDKNRTENNKTAP